MSMIQLLDNQVVKQLKGSLVITSMEQCLEELIKNALDAAASTIDIQVDIEHSMLQVTDNGTGILPTDLVQLAQRHVTSKCHSLIELHGTRTFGFRGEVLAALSTMSILQIISRHRTSSDSFMATWKDGQLIQHSICKDNHAYGTTVLIPSLFYKYPVRQKHQRTNLESLKHTLTLFALIFPQVKFTLIDRVQNSKCMVTKKISSSLGIFQLLFGQRFTQEIKAYSIHEDQLQLHGYFGGDGVPTKVHQYIYVNKHYISPADNDLYKTVNTIIQSYSSERLAEDNIKRGRDYPIFLIKIDCTCIASYDITFLSEHVIYPRLMTLLKRLTMKYIQSTGKQLSQDKRKKQEPLSKKKQKTASLYLEHSYSTIPLPRSQDTPQFGRTLLNNYPSLPSTINNIDTSRLRRYPVSTLDHSMVSTELPSLSLPLLSSTSSTSSASSISSASSTALISSTSSTSSLSSSSTFTSPYSINNSSYGFQTPQKLQREDLQSAKVLAQVDTKWIVCLLDRILLLVDQHAADERIKLESMLNSSLDIKYLEPCLDIIMTQHESDLAVKYASDLQRWGIYIERKDIQKKQQHHHTGRIGSPHFAHHHQKRSSSHFTSNSQKDNMDRYTQQVFVTRLPQMIVERCILDPQLLTDLIREYLHDLESSVVSRLACPPGMMEILKSKACRGAIMFNDPLSIDQCTKLIRSLAKCRFPFQCAHGRPSVVPLMNLGDNQRQSRPIRWETFVK
ncbi:uncharacterized protein BX664DRAFT_140852 [Halteromyces radiatus]|uniref:uncharacterized protein n=1 Tax=Halteromyces radiatus TaxID=101107 RepID=UPI00221FD2FE|nr:uncharacterized protein BX664DRAFT_140852 [Halteromyces radiatus]KAI8089752.1 hypothetical protein BX664DRAFT_140852 [Halteromyces radiatus]